MSCHTSFVQVDKVTRSGMNIVGVTVALNYLTGLDLSEVTKFKKGIGRCIIEIVSDLAR